MAVSALLRSVQSDMVRDLARRAVDQGWDLYPNGGGHLAAVNPDTGARVTLATSAGGGHATSNVRAAFARAGLDLRSKAERRRSRRQEVRPMQVRDVTPTVPAPVVPMEAREVQSRPNAPQAAGGKFAMRGPQEVLDVGGFRVVIGERQDGVWMGYTRDLGLRARRRTWYSSDGRQALLDRAAQDVADRPPVLDAPAPEEEPAPADTVEEATAAVESGPLAGFHVVQADPEEFPLARALDRLDVSMAPALAALEAAGKGDAAALVRAEVSRTPLEEELLALYRRVMTGA